MTMQPEMKLTCDRCAAEAHFPLDSGGPVHKRGQFPDWLTLTVGTEPGTPATHLCGDCVGPFRAFMEEASR